jgi:hypothetical protein
MSTFFCMHKLKVHETPTCPTWPSQVFDFLHGYHDEKRQLEANSVIQLLAKEDLRSLGELR